ncbi:MAG: serine hydrolase [Bacteroidota bacterium]
MKILKKIGLAFLLLLVVLNLLIIISGKTYLYKGIANTYLKGRSGPAIDESNIFANREIKATNYQAWVNASDYNKKNIPDSLLEELKNYKTVAYFVAKNDSVKFEEYWEGYSDQSQSNSFSMAKSILGVLTGIAIKEGKIKDVSQKISDFLPQFKEGKKSEITIKHLLTMSSGMDFDEDYINPLAYPAAAYYGSDLQQLTYKYNAKDEPGKVFKYLSGDSQLLAFLIEKAVGKNVSKYAEEKLWNVIGAKTNALWNLDKEDGHEKAFCCFNAAAPDFARIGNLYLHKGNWKGLQLIDTSYINESIIPADLVEDDGTPNKRYGYKWWMLNYKNHDVFYMRGILGQYVFVIPDLNMIVCRLGHKRDKPKDSKLTPKDIYLYLDIALVMYEK